MKFQKRMLVMMCASVMSCCAIGCETFTNGTPASKKKKKDSGSWLSFKKKEYQIPQTMNVTWTNDVLTLPGKAATRGFGGRFYFYNEKTQAIPVDGDLVVYGFDDSFQKHTGEDLGQAEKRFRFTAEQFTTHFSESELGASYSVWIPWDEAYGDQKRIMLIPTFMTKDGRLIRGAAANLNLPGKAVEDPNFGLPQQASSVIPTALNGQLHDARLGNSQSSNGMRTTTIQLPANSLRRSNPSTPGMNERADTATMQASYNAPQQQIPTNNGYASNPSYASNPNPSNFGQGLVSSQPTMTTAGTINANIPTPFDRSNKAMASHLSSMPFAPFASVGSQGTSTTDWAQPGYSPASNSGGQSGYSAPGSPQAPALQAAQPNAYQTR